MLGRLKGAMRARSDASPVFLSGRVPGNWREISVCDCWSKAARDSRGGGQEMLLNPGAGGLFYFSEDILIRAAGLLLDLEAVVGGFEPVHSPVGDRSHDRVHDLAGAEFVASAVEAERRHLDIGEVIFAQFLRLAGRVERVSTQDQPIGRAA